MSDDKLVPVNPARDDKGRIKSLLPFVGDNPDDALPYPEALKPEDLAERKTIVNFFQTSASTAAKLGLMDALATSSDYLSEAAVFEVLFGTHKIRSGDVTRYLVRETFWGSSIRVVLRVKALDAKVTSGFAQLAASVEMRKAQVEYEIKTVGAVTPQMLSTALEGMPLFGTLDFDSYTRINEATLELATALTTETPAEASPVAVKLKYHPAKHSMVEALSMRFAMIAIAHQKPLEVALKEAPESVDHFVIQEAYQTVLAGAKAPLGGHAERARRWLNA